MFIKGNGGSEFRWLLKHTKPYMKWQIASVSCMVVSTLAALVDPLILKWLIDIIIPHRDIVALALAAGLLLLLYIVRTVLGGTAGRLTYHVNQQFVLNMRVRLFKHLTSLSADHHDTTPVGSSMFIIRDSLDELGNVGADFFTLFLRTAILFIFSVVVMLRLNLRLTLIMLPLIPLFLITVQHFRRVLQKACDAVQEEGSVTTSFLQEHISSVVQIQLLTREKLQLRKAFRVWAGLARVGYQRRKAEYLYAVSSTLVVGAATVAVIAYGGLQVMQGALTVGGLIAFYSYLSRLFEPFYITVEISSRFQRATSCIRRIRGLLDKMPSVAEPEAPVPVPVSGNIQPEALHIQGVSFSYAPDRQILKNVSLRIEPGERVALVGPSGCGKSTLAKLIARLYDTSEGKIWVDDVDIRRIPLKTLRQHVCYVPQRAKLFNGSLADNLRYGNSSASPRELQEAAAMAELMPVIAKLPNGWSQSLGPGGELLSGGERQRVAIARAILMRPQLLILDEANSEMDSVAEQLVCERLNVFFPNTTIIAISHRLASLSWVSRIFLLNQGEIADTGTHASLYGSNELYTVLYDQQNVVEHV